MLAPGFDRDIEEPVPDAIAIAPEFPIVVVEGNYLLLDDDATAHAAHAHTAGWARVGSLFDVTVFVDVDPAVRLERLIARHVAFGKSPEAARAWALGPDETNARVIQATAGRADHVMRVG